MSGIGAPELLIILVVVLLLFGSTRLPKLARSLGQASREFKEGVKEGARDDTAKQAQPDDSITMTRAELDALLEERERRARKDDTPES
jgi:sec-independent protein translocase protein TatA